MAIEHLNLRHLRYFYEVAKTENMNEAARRLLVSPAAVFSTIKKVEEETGCRLFDRVGKNIRINEKGISFSLFAAKTLDRAAELGRAFREEGMHRIKIGVINPIAFSRIIRQAMEHFPEIQLEHSIVSVYQMQNPLEIGGYDIVFAALDDMSDSAWQSMILQESLPCLIAPPGHPLSGSGGIILKECARLQYIFLQKGYSVRKYIDELFRLAGVKPEIAAECEYNMLRMMLMANLGVTISTTGSRSWEQYRGMEYIPINDPQVKRVLAMFWNEEHVEERPLLRDVVEFLRAGAPF